MAIRCCNGCVAPKRHAGCHATCPEYLKEHEQHVAEKQARQQEKIKQARLDEYVVKNCRSARKRVNK